MIKKRKNLDMILFCFVFGVLSIGFISACNLQITKSSDKCITEPGEVITFTLIYENVGESNCTGGGVKIQDVLENKLEYNGNYNVDLVNDIDGEGVYYGWQEIPGYDEATNTLTWNAHIVSPGERGTITFEGIVLEGDEECVDFEINNYFSSWSDQEGWKDSNTITILVENECPEPCCGDGIVNGEEECDLGGDNGIPCTPAYGGSCTYCSGVCESVTIFGGYCGDGIKQSNEECDLGEDNGMEKGCSSTCTIEEEDCVCPCPCPGCYIDDRNYCDCEEEEDEEDCEDDCEDECDEDCDKKDKSNNLNELCYPNWMCSGWSECINGHMARSCTDTNNCEESYGIPSEQSPCVDKVISTSYVLDENRGISIWVVAGGIVAIILIIILVLLIG